LALRLAYQKSSANLSLGKTLLSCRRNVNSQIRRTHKLDSGVLERRSNPLHRIEIRFYPTFKALQPTDRRKCQTSFLSKPILPPARESSGRLNLSYVRILFEFLLGAASSAQYD
jgi:hypothetical protein